MSVTEGEPATEVKSPIEPEKECELLYVKLGIGGLVFWVVIFVLLDLRFPENDYVGLWFIAPIFMIVAVWFGSRKYGCDEW